MFDFKYICRNFFGNNLNEIRTIVVNIYLKCLIFHHALNAMFNIMRMYM